MTNNLAAAGQKFAKRILLLQASMCVFLVGVVAIVTELNIAVSVLYGVFIHIIPSAVFSYFAFKYAGARQNQLVVRSFRKGQAIKLILTIFLFAIVFKHTNVQALPLFIGFVMALLVYWPCLIFISRAKQN